jgi:hypothetical protein
MDIGSSERLAMQNLQIPDTAEIIPKWLFPTRFPNKKRFTSCRRPDAVLFAPTISAKTKKQHTSN